MSETNNKIIPIEIFKQKEMIHERDSAFLSLDKNKILNYFKKYNINPYYDGKDEYTEEEFWAGIHYSILSIRSATNEQRTKSRYWLIKHNYTPN